MRLRIILWLMTCAILTMASSCDNHTRKPSNSIPTKTPIQSNDKHLSQIYENKYFSINYPANYYVDANFSGKTASAEELLDMEADSIWNLQKNELYILPKYQDGAWIPSQVYIVLSRHKLDFPIRMFMELSIYSKENEEPANQLSLIGSSEVDSISFAGYPALSVNFAYKGENGDTLVQHQIIIQTEDYSLYYLNHNYNYSHQESFEIGEKILSTFKFKE